MKKFLVAVMSVVMAICALSMVACGNVDVKGKTFKYDSFTVVSGEVPEEMKTTLEASFNNGMTLTFNEDGTITSKMGDKEESGGTWKQEGNKLIVGEEGYSMECTIEGDKFYMEETNAGITLRIYYKVV